MLVYICSMFHVRINMSLRPTCRGIYPFQVKRKTNCSRDNTKHGKAKGITNIQTYMHAFTHTCVCVLCFICYVFSVCLSSSPHMCDRARPRVMRAIQRRSSVSYLLLECCHIEFLCAFSKIKKKNIQTAKEKTRKGTSQQQRR